MHSTDWHRFLPNGIYISLIFFLPTDDLFLTDGLVSHGTHGIHGFFIAARCFFLPQILLIVTNYNFFSHRLHRFKDFFSFLIRLFRLCLKRRSMDLHRFLPSGIYISLIFFLPQIAQILQIFLCGDLWFLWVLWAKL